MRRLILAAMLAFATPAAADFAITNVNLIDGNGGMPQPGMTVVVKGDRIAAVTTAAAARVPRGLKRIDGTGKFLMPGLMDMHIHLIGAGQASGVKSPPGVVIDRNAGLEYLQGYLYDGVTSVFDAGNNPALTLDLRAKERAGQIVSPRIFATGWTLGYPNRWRVDNKSVGVADWADTLKMLDAQIAAKPDLQKLAMEPYGVGPTPLGPTLPVDLMQKMIEYLHEHGVRTVMHVTNEVLARAAGDAGLDAYAHPVSIGRMSEDFLKILVARQSPVVTTLVVHDDIIKGNDQSNYLDDPFTLEVISKEEIAARRVRPLTPFGDIQTRAWHKVLYPYQSENVKRLHDAGGVVVAGTDRGEGPMLHRELALLAEAGIPPAAIIRIGTLNGAKFLAREKDLGTVETGKLADLLLLKADPTADIRNARQIDTVIKGGQVIDRSTLKVEINRK